MEVTLVSDVLVKEQRCLNMSHMRGKGNESKRIMGAADVFLETVRKDCCRVRSRGARAGSGAVFHDVDVHEAGCGASGVSDQTVSGTVAARRSQVCGCRPQAAHTVGDAVSRGGIVPVWYAAEAGGDGAWRQRRCGASLDETVPRRWNGGAGDRNGGMPCRRPEPIASRWAMTRMCCVGGYGSWSWRTR